MINNFSVSGSGQIAPVTASAVKSSEAYTEIREPQIATTFSSMSAPGVAESLGKTSSQADLNSQNEVGTLVVVFRDIFLSETRDLGEPSEAEGIVRGEFERRPFVVKEALQELCLQAFRDGDVTIACGVLELFARLPEREFSPANKAMALSALAQTNEIMKEYGIRAFEMWASKDCLEHLKRVHCASRRIEKYRLRVIEELSSLPCHS